MTRTLSMLALASSLAVCPLIACADDYGPHRDIRAIRHDLPIIEKRGGVNLDDVQEIAVDSVVVEDGTALAQFHDIKAPLHAQIVQLAYKLDRWWIDNYISTGDADYSDACGVLMAPTVAFLKNEHVPSTLATLATDHMPAVRDAISIVQQFHVDPPKMKGGVTTGVGTDCYNVSSDGPPRFSPGILRFQTLYRREIEGGGIYQVMLALAPNDGDEYAEIVSIQSRAPTRAESWANAPSGNSYFFISGRVDATQAVHVNGGTTLDVWFPYVLDPSLRYSLTIAAPKTLSLGPVQGSLKDNTLHFVLPAFTAAPGAELMGEIESD